MYKRGEEGCDGGGGGVGWPPASQGTPMVPAEGGPKILKLQSSWHRRHRSKILAVSLKHWKGRGGVQGGGGGGPPPTVYGRSNTSLGGGERSAGAGDTFGGRTLRITATAKRRGGFGVLGP